MQKMARDNEELSQFHEFAPGMCSKDFHSKLVMRLENLRGQFKFNPNSIFLELAKRWPWTQTCLKYVCNNSMGIKCVHFIFPFPKTWMKARNVKKLETITDNKYISKG